MTLDRLAATMSRQEEIRQRADDALRAGRISQAEYRFFLKRELGIETSKERPLQQRRKEFATKVVAMFFVMAITLGFGAFLLYTPSQTGFTGYITAPSETEQVMDLVVTENTSIPLNITNTSTLQASGSHLGDVRITLEMNGEQLLVYQGTSLSPIVWTDKESYALNQSVNITVNASEYTLWLEYGGERELISDDYITITPGEFILDALINDSGNVTIASTNFTVRNETNTSNDVVRTSEPVIFTAACIDTCELNQTGNLTLQLEVDDELVLDELIITQPGVNTPPEQIQELSDQAVQQGETVTIQLDDYFTDPDGDTIIYDYMNAAGVDLVVEGNELMITGREPGSVESLVYASDLYGLVQSNLYTITVEPGPTPFNRSNQTVNQTVNATTNQTMNETAEASHDCSHPNVNLRPAYCFLGVEDLAYNELVAPLKNKEQMIVGRFTRYGNLIIRGLLIENGGGVPGRDDFAIGLTERIGFEEDFTPTAWIAADGDLHLRGSIHEEQAQLVPPQYNTYIVQNNNGFVLGYFDQTTGDLYLKGNIVQLGNI